MGFVGLFAACAEGALPLPMGEVPPMGAERALSVTAYAVPAPPKGEPRASAYKKPIVIMLLYLIFGRLAAATAWPTRRIFSSGRVTLHLAARAGYSSARISLHTRRMVSPPLPDMTRPMSIM